VTLDQDAGGPKHANDHKTTAVQASFLNKNGHSLASVFGRPSILLRPRVVLVQFFGSQSKDHQRGFGAATYAPQKTVFYTALMEVSRIQQRYCGFNCRCAQVFPERSVALCFYEVKFRDLVLTARVCMFCTVHIFCEKARREFLAAACLSL
jgi:hypothetical protein